MQYKLSSSLKMNTPFVTPYVGMYQPRPERHRTDSPVILSTNTAAPKAPSDDVFQSPQPLSAAAARMQYVSDVDASRDESFVDVSTLHERQQPPTDTSFSSIGRKTTNIFNDLSLSASDKSFAAIQDGGFHSGYWKAKYNTGDEPTYYGGGRSRDFR